MDKNTQIGLGLISAALVGAGIYLGFVKKGEENLTWFQKMKKKPEEKKDVVPPIDANSDPVNHTGTKPKKVVVPPNAPPVAPTPPAKSLSVAIDEKKGTWITAPGNDLAVYYIADSTLFKRYKKGESIGRLGDNLKNGYHKLFEVSGDMSSKGVKVADTWLKLALKL